MVLGERDQHKDHYYRLKHVCAAIPNESKSGGLPEPNEEPVFAELAPVERPAKRGAAITIRLGGVEIQIHNGAQPDELTRGLLPSLMKAPFLRLLTRLLVILFNPGINVYFLTIAQNIE